MARKYSENNKVMKEKILLAMALMCVMVLASCGGGDDGGSSSSGSGGGNPYPTTIYDVLDINGAKYACYGYRSPVTFESAWNLTTHSGKLRLPCGTLAKAESGTHDYDYMFYIHLKGTKDLTTGCKLQDFSPKFESVGEEEVNYVSGSATVTDKKNNDYITIKFESFKFGSGSKTYILNGTAQLMIEESGGSGGGTPSSPSTYYMDVSIGSSAHSQTIELTNLRTSISTATCSASWLTASKVSYSSGSPKLQLQVTANTSISSRYCTVTVTATDGNDVIITVVQNGISMMDVNLDASASSKTIELSGLKTSISKISSSESWLTASNLSYSSGSPKIQIKATANTSTISRECKVTVIASDDNEVVITVVQNGHPQPQTNDEVSDKDALSREL